MKPPSARARHVRGDQKRFAKSVALSSDDIVFLSGSRAEGWQNDGSDYDWYVITELDQSQSSSDAFWLPAASMVRVRYVRVGDDHVEVQYWPRHLVEQLIEFLNLIRLKGFSEIPHRYVDFVHRLTVGIPALNGRQFNALQSSLLRDEFRYYRAVSEERLFEAYLHDALYFLDDSRPFEALLASRMAVEASIDCYLSLRGQTNPGAKWRLRKLERLIGSHGLELRYRRFVCGCGEPTTDELTSWSREACLFADDVNLCCQLNLDYDRLYGPCTDRGTPSPPNPMRDLRVRLRLSLSGRRNLLAPSGVYQLTSGCALVWAFCSGTRSAAEIANRLANVASISPTTATNDTHTAINILNEAGVLFWQAPHIASTVSTL